MKKGDKFKFVDYDKNVHFLTYTGTRREYKGVEFEFFTDDKGSTTMFTDSEVKQMVPCGNVSPHA